LEDEFAAGRITNRMFAEREAPFYAGRSLVDGAKALDDLPLMPGIERTTAALKARGVHILLTTLAPRWAAGVIARRFGFDGWTGCAMTEDCGVLTGAIDEHITPDDKRTFVENYCAQHGFAMTSVLAVGDSRSDVPLFRAVGYSVAINATAEARLAATCAIDTGDFSDILGAIPGFGVSARAV
jgi:phosphoserine phosphatase